MIHRRLNSLILLPDHFDYQSPADLGLTAEVVTFPNAQGLALHGLFCQPQGTVTADAPPPGMAPVVLFCPGTAGNLSSHLHYIEILCRAGLAVLGFDYTGFGRSAGQPSLTHLIADVLSACDFLHQRHHAARFGIFGVSLGANVALQAAVLRPDILAGVAVEGLALQREVIRGLLTTGSMGPHFLTAITYEGLPRGQRRLHVLNPTWHIPPRLADVVSWAGAAMFPFQAKDPQVQAKALADTPVFFIHGADDPLLPCEATLQVYLAKPGVKRLWLIPGVGHAQEPILAQDAEYAAQLGDFFHAILPSSVSAGRRFPALTMTPLAHGPTPAMWRLTNPGPPGLVLATLGSRTAIDFRTLWLTDHADVPTRCQEQPFASGLRLFEVAGRGDMAYARLTPRGQRYQEAFQPWIRALSQTLHERRLADLAPLLQALPTLCPEPPFDFFLGLYYVQIMLRAQRKLPHIARAAAELFVRSWHYGEPARQPGTPSALWDLASAILRRHVTPSLPGTGAQHL